MTCQGARIKWLCAAMMKVIISVIDLLSLCCTVFRKLAGKSSQELASWGVGKANLQLKAREHVNQQKYLD
jgi:hypothetical protein